MIHVFPLISYIPCFYGIFILFVYSQCSSHLEFLIQSTFLQSIFPSLWLALLSYSFLFQSTFHHKIWSAIRCHLLSRFWIFNIIIQLMYSCISMSITYIPSYLLIYMQHISLHDFAFTTFLLKDLFSHCIIIVCPFIYLVRFSLIIFLFLNLLSEKCAYILAELSGFAVSYNCVLVVADLLA